MSPPPLKKVAYAFEPAPFMISITDITPLHMVTDVIKQSQKYGQIRSSIEHSGLAEPPVVARDRGEAGRFLLRDGHLRMAVLQEMGVCDVSCLVATDDDAYTYNKHLNRLAIVQEHQMILKAVERGVSEEVIAKVLNVDVSNIRMKRRLLVGPN